MSRIGFLGLGSMGGPMAGRLVGAGHQVSVFDVVPAAREAFAGYPGCRIAASPAEAAEGAEFLVTMLPETAHVRSALFGEAGAAAALPEGALVIEMSTGDALACFEIADLLAARGLRMIDAPVGRTPADAAAGTLLILAGGAEADLAEARPLLESLGDEIVHAGPLGHGIKLKLVNNYMSMIGMVMTAETLMFAERLGLDREQTVHVLQSTTAGRGQINVNFPKKVLAGDITPDFTLRLGLKDLSLALALAKSAGAPLALGGVSQQLFALAEAWGRAEQDCTAMLLLLEDIAKGREEEPAT